MSGSDQTHSRAARLMSTSLRQPVRLPPRTGTMSLGGTPCSRSSKRHSSFHAPLCRSRILPHVCGYAVLGGHDDRLTRDGCSAARCGSMNKTGICAGSGGSSLKSVFTSLKYVNLSFGALRKRDSVVFVESKGVGIAVIGENYRTFVDFFQ